MAMLNYQTCTIYYRNNLLENPKNTDSVENTILFNFAGFGRDFVGALWHLMAFDGTSSDTSSQQDINMGLGWPGDAWGNWVLSQV